MKRFFRFGILAFMAVMTMKVFALDMDTVPQWGTPDWKAYVQADKDYKAAHIEGDYERAATLTNFSWVKAWAYYDAAGKLATGAKEDGLWNFGEYQLTSQTVTDVLNLLFKSRAAMERALKIGVYPKSGPNVMAHLKVNLDNAESRLREK